MSEDSAPQEKSKSELFADNPDQFQDLTECLLVVKRDKEGRISVLNQCQTVEECLIVKGYAEEACDVRKQQLRMKHAQTASKIVKPNGHFLNGIRNMGKR